MSGEAGQSGAGLLREAQIVCVIVMTRTFAAQTGKNDDALGRSEWGSIGPYSDGAHSSVGRAADS